MSMSPLRFRSTPEPASCNTQTLSPETRALTVSVGACLYVMAAFFYIDVPQLQAIFIPTLPLER
jgi:hypothetical protein